jgi:HprK-related kinase A
VTASFRGLDFTFAVDATDPALQAVVEHTFAACRVDDDIAVATRYTLLERGTDATKLVIFENDVRLFETADPALGLAYLVWQVNQRVIETSGTRLLLHAAAAAHHGRAVLLPAPSGAGKSTLVAGLVAAGCAYLTDDLCAVGADARTVLPYPKPIAIAIDTVRILGRSGRPVPSHHDPRFAGADLFLEPGDLGGTTATAAVPAVLVVVPRYDATATTELAPMTRGEAAVLLAEQSFNFDRIGVAALHAVADLLRECACYRLTYGSLDEAVGTVTGLLLDAARRPA